MTPSAVSTTSPQPVSAASSAGEKLWTSCSAMRKPSSARTVSVPDSLTNPPRVTPAGKTIRVDCSAAIVNVPSAGSQTLTGTPTVTAVPSTRTEPSSWMFTSLKSAAAAR